MTAKRSWNDDHYTRKARRERYLARSVYKLQEMDQRFHLLQQGQRVLDLGCAPGSWLQYALQRTGGSGHVLGIDRTPCRVPGADVHCSDIHTVNGKDLGEAFHVVLSDMAPDTSGQAFVDAARSLELAETAWQLAQQVLRVQGSFVCKVFQSADLDALVAKLRPRFSSLKRFRPQSTRTKSNEIYLVCRGFRSG